MNNKTIYIIAGLLVAGAAGYFLYKKYQAKKEVPAPSLKESITSEKPYKDDDRAVDNDLAIKDLTKHGLKGKSTGTAV